MSKSSKSKHSVVYTARHKVDQQLYAVKEVTLEVVAANQAAIKEKLEAMLKEVRLLATIQDVNVLRYYSSWIELVEEAKYCYVVQESMEENEAEVQEEEPQTWF